MTVLQGMRGMEVAPGTSLVAVEVEEQEGGWQLSWAAIS